MTNPHENTRWLARTQDKVPTRDIVPENDIPRAAYRKFSGRIRSGLDESENQKALL
jgi:hypothetical protein